MRHGNMTSVVAPQLVQVTRALEMTSHYAVLDGPDAVYLCKEDPPWVGVQLASALGARLPALITAVGKACLAWLSPGELAGHARAADGSKLNDKELAEIQRELEDIRTSGYSADNGATARGIQCIAAPVFDVDGIRGSIGVSYLRDDDLDGDTIIAAVVDAASRTTNLLGGKAKQ